MRIDWSPTWFESWSWSRKGLKSQRSDRRVGRNATALRRSRNPLRRLKTRRRSSGGLLGTQFGRPAVYRIELLEDRTLLSAVTWNGNGNDNLWNDGKNWSSGSVPQSTDDVTISAAAGTTIQVATTSVTINSLTTNAAISVASGITFSSPAISASANFLMAGGTLQGATLSLTGGAELVVTASESTLKGVTVDGNMDLTEFNGAFTNVTNGLTLNGTAYVGNAAGSTYEVMDFNGTQSLLGTGTVIFGKSSGVSSIACIGTSATLTIGPGITIRGSSGSIVGPSTNKIVNKGTIDADDSGGLVGSFIYDTDSGGVTEAVSNVIVTSLVTNPAPQAVYQTERTSNPTYTIPNLTPLGSYMVRLDFAELDATAPGQRLMNVTINGMPALTDFDTYATTGARFKAVAKPLSATANAQGQIVIAFAGASGSTYPASINGIELYSGTTQVLAINCGLVAGGTFTISRATIPTIVNNQGTLEVSNGEALNVSGLTGDVGTPTMSGTGTSMSLGGSGFTISHGLTATAGQILAIYGSWTNESGSTISATGATLDLGDQTSSSTNVWSNSGTISVTNSTLSLGGEFTTSGLGTLDRSGGTVNVVGTVENSGTTLAIGPTTGIWYLSGGTVVGGTLTETEPDELLLTHNGGTLDGITVDGDIVATGYFDDYADVKDGLTLNGTAYLGNAAGSNVGELLFTNKETLGGTGTVLFGKDNVNGSTNDLINLSSSTVMIGPGITIRGSSGLIDGSTSTIVNEGTILADDSGGLVGSFVYDTDFSGGTTRSTPLAIDTSLVTNPAPQAVYQTERYGTFTYTISNLTPNGAYKVQLDFAEFDATGPGQKRINVTINGTLALPAFDIYAAAGGMDKALAESFSTSANASGQIVIAFAAQSPSTFQASVNGVEIYSGSTQVLAINAGLVPGGTITIGPTILTNQGTIEATNGETVSLTDPTLSTLTPTWTNNGTITANAGKVILGGPESFDRWTNNGTLDALNGGQIVVPTTLQMDSSAALGVSANSTMTVEASLEGNTTNNSGFDPTGTVNFDGLATSSAPQLLEVMSDDLGATPEGFTNNFDYGTLTVTNDTFVELVDQSHNSSGTGSEALYADTLIVANGSTLDLNGLHVYTLDAQISTSAKIENGTVDQVPTVTVTDAGGTFKGNPYPATETATDANGNNVAGTPSFTYYVGTTATGTGSSTAPTDAGTYTVVASFTSGNPSYGNAQSAPLTFTINPAVPTVVASDPSGLFTGNPFTATATVTGVGGATLSGGNLAFTYYVGSTVSGNGSTTAPTSIGTYTVVAGFTSTDTNYVTGPTDSQPVTFVIAKAPAFTSPNKVSFAVGVNSSFTLTASGYPASSFANTAGTLPQGLSLTPAGVLSGMPASGTAGRSTLTFSASDGFGTNATQTFTLTVTATSSAPAITSANQATFTIGTSGKFTVKVTGSPTPTLGLTGTLPKGLTFDPATGVLSGKPGAGTEGTHTLTFTATNGIGTPVSQTFTLTIDQVPKITSANTATFVVGQSGKFTVKANGFPKPTFIESGSLPTGVTFNTTTGVLSGIPAAGTANSYSVTFTATNAAGDSAPQSFTLVVSNAPLAAVVPSSGPSPFGTGVGPTSLPSTTIVQATASVAPIEAAAASSSGPSAVSASSANASAANGRGVNNTPYPFGSQIRDAIEADVDSEAIQWVGVSAAVEILNA
jgi:hypothetical protein